MRLDRLVGKWAGMGKRRTKELFDSGQVSLNGRRVSERGLRVGKFDRVEVAGQVLQARTARYVLMHKPLGVVSATVDEEHPTVIDLIDQEWAGELHLAGRLDRFTSGLLVLTNDGGYSEALTRPEEKVPKRYHVRVDGVISEEVVRDFEKGIYFAKEKVMTEPAQLNLLSDKECRLTIYEGKHHQIKRMFAPYGLKVLSLHREAIGSLVLSEDLAVGQWREFQPVF